jgi:ABC-type cobalamin/Fe3+-siderophores transport system ATPase subunit
MSAPNKAAQSSSDLPVRQGALSAQEIRAECPQFRILIIGKANAGKTTILRKVCNAKPDAKPIIYDAEGKEISLVVRPEVQPELQPVATKVRLENLAVLAQTNQKPGVIMVVTAVQLLAV